MSGWSSITDTWTYNSTDNPTGVINWTGANSKVSAGMRIRFNNGGNTIYGIVTAVTGSTMTFLHEMNEANNNAVNLMANSAITNVHISAYKTPYGFPSNPDRWSVIIVDNALRSKSSPTTNVWYNLGGVSITVPIGLWDLSYSTPLSAYRASTGNMEAHSSLSTSSSSEGDVKFRCLINGNSMTDVALQVGASSVVSLTSKTIYYLLALTKQSVDAIYFLTNRGITVIRATCAYL